MRRRYGVMAEEDIHDDRPVTKSRRAPVRPVARPAFKPQTPKEWFRDWNWRRDPQGPPADSPEVAEYLAYLWRELTAK